MFCLYGQTRQIQLGKEKWEMNIKIVMKSIRNELQKLQIFVRVFKDAKSCFMKATER